MESSASIYKSQQASTSWTRIEMLIELYDFAIASMESLQESSQNYPEQVARDSLRVQKAIWGIFSGLDDQQEISQNIMRLLLFVVSCVQNEEYEPALNILRDLRAAYGDIREEANQLESRGEIPPIVQHSEIEVTL